MNTTIASRLKFALFGMIAATTSGCIPAAKPGAAAASGPSTTAPALSRYEYHDVKMGTDFHLIFFAADQASADATHAAVVQRVDQLNTVLSDYDPESEISKLSRLSHDAPMTQPVAVSQDLWTVLEASKLTYDRSDGTFDITVGPFVQLWRWSRRQQQLPSAERLAEARKSVGFNLLKLDPEHHTAQLLAAKMRLDVGGIAKGYVADEALRLIEKRGIHSALVDSGGNMAIADPPPGQAGWKVAIQALDKPGEMAEYLSLARCGISSSGDTYRFVEIDGVRYSHILDPKTGVGMTAHIGITVIAPDAFLADALDTPVCLMGVEKGLAMIEAVPGVAARVTTLEGNKVNVYYSQRYNLLATRSAIR